MRGKEDYRRTWDGVKMSIAELQTLQQQLSESSINSL